MAPHIIEIARLDFTITELIERLRLLRIDHGAALVKIDALERHNQLLRSRLR